MENSYFNKIIYNIFQTVEMMIKHSDGQYSPFDMAQYVFWTGDESGVAHAVENLIRRGTVNYYDGMCQILS